MTPLKLTQNEGAIGYSQNEIAMNNYYNSHFGDFYIYDKTVRKEFQVLSIENDRDSPGSFLEPHFYNTFKRAKHKRECFELYQCFIRGHSCDIFKSFFMMMGLTLLFWMKITSILVIMPATLISLSRPS